MWRDCVVPYVSHTWVTPQVSKERSNEGVFCKDTTWFAGRWATALSCGTHAASHSAMWTDGRHSCASVCSCDLLWSGHTPLFILFTFVSHQLRCVYVKVLRANNRLCVMTFLSKMNEHNWVVTLLVIQFERDYMGYESLLSGKIFVCLKCLFGFN